MAYGVALQAILDRPDRIGRVTAWGAGRDWKAIADTEEQKFATGDPRYRSLWRVTGGRLEWLEPLEALAPRGRVVWADQDPEDWTLTPDEGEWAGSEVTALLGNVSWLQLSAPQEEAVAQHAAAVIADGQALFGVRLDAKAAPAEGEEEVEGEALPRSVAVGLGYGSTPGVWLAVWVPIGGGEEDGEDREVEFRARVQGEDWVTVARWEGGPSPSSSGQEAKSLRVDWSTVGDGTLITLEGRQWYVARDWQDAGGTVRRSAIPAGTDAWPAVALVNLAGCVNVAQVRYPLTLAMRPERWTYWPAPYNLAGTPGYQARIIPGPVDTGVSVAFEGTAVPGGRFERPVVTFTAPDGGGGYATGRAHFLAVQGYRNPTFVEGESEPVYTRDNAACHLVEASGSVSESYRDARCSLVLRAEPGETFPALWPSTWVQVLLTPRWEESEEEEEPDPVKLFVGWGAPAREVGRGEFGVEYALDAQDGWERLRRTAAMYLPPLEGWLVRDAYSHVLQRGGFPPEWVNVTGAGAAERLPTGPLGDDRLLQFQPDVNLGEVADALDKSSGYDSGIAPDGRTGLLVPKTHTPGYYDVEITEEVAGRDGLMVAVHRQPVDDAFVNRLFALGEGGEAPATHGIADWDSIGDPASAHFVGTTWDAAMILPDTEDVEAAAEREWEERRANAEVLTVELHGYAIIWPRQFVRLDLPSSDVAVGAIGRVRHLEWRVTRDRRIEQTLEVVIVEWPTEE